LMKVPLKINIEKLNVRNLDISNEEYNPKVKTSSTVYFDNVTGVLKNVTNVPAVYMKNRISSFSGSGLFMHEVPIHCSFSFDLSKYKTGDFSIDIHVEEMDKQVINPFTEPLGLFSIKKGKMKEGTAHIEGNNFNAKVKMLMLYNDLHITPLKPGDDSTGLKRKHVTSFIANTFFIKNDNPSHGDQPRTVETVVGRDSYRFFSLVWKSLFLGMMKTIGVPEKFAQKGSG
jgi:hypothetical protein